MMTRKIYLPSVKSLFSNLFGDDLKQATFLGIGLGLQYIAFMLTDSNDRNLLSLVSGICGVFAVVLCAERKLSYYLFAWPQLITYVILCYRERLYGEIWENVFYAVTMVIGMLVWFRKDAIDKSGEKVKSRQLGAKNLIWLLTGVSVAIILLWQYLLRTDDSQPFMDALTTIPAIVAQILLTFRYREQWIFWLMIDLGSVWMWMEAGDRCMVSQYVFWSLNCILGWIYWSKEKE